MLPQSGDRLNLYPILLQGITYFVGGVFLVSIQVTAQELRPFTYYARHALGITFLAVAFILLGSLMPKCGSLKRIAHKIDQSFRFGILLVSIVIVIGALATPNLHTVLRGVILIFLICIFVVFFYHQAREICSNVQKMSAQAKRILLPTQLSIVLSMFAFAQYIMEVKTVYIMGVEMVFEPSIFLAASVVALGIAVYNIYRTINRQIKEGK